MKVIEFKNLMSLAKGLKLPVKSQLFWNDKDGKLTLVRDYGERLVDIVQSNSFALLTINKPEEGPKPSWCNWPKASELNEISANVAEITFDGGKIIYDFSLVKVN
jgi:hypothetical protein